MHVQYTSTYSRTTVLYYTFYNLMKQSGTGTAIVSSYTLLEKLCQISLYVTDDVMFVKQRKLVEHLDTAIAIIVTVL